MLSGSLLQSLMSHSGLCFHISQIEQPPVNPLCFQSVQDKYCIYYDGATSVCGRAEVSVMSAVVVLSLVSELSVLALALDIS